ncbi:MAG: hypothetical protein NZM12_10915 [Steroidobacteraceae bacterium]|nr:hypothetical protein [Steroidobacteraceae bacterium]
MPSALQVAALGRQPGQRRFLVAHLPHGSDVKPGDRLAWRGAQWEVSGVAEQERLAFLRVEAEEVV